MPTKIRLQRHGRKGYAFFHIVAADSRAPRDGKFIEKLGVYNPNTNPATINLDVDSAVQWLQNGVNLVTFPEGTRSKTGRMGSFKKGAFKMAQKCGAPIVPISIQYADKVQPLDYAFPAKSSRSRPRIQKKWT